MSRPLSVRMDDHLAADLAVMARAGLNASDAVRTALALAASAYANAWALNAVPEGVQPEITAFSITPYDAAPQAYDARMTQVRNPGPMQTTR